MYALDYSNAVEALAKRPLLFLAGSRYLLRPFFEAALRGEVTSPAGLELPADVWIQVAREVGFSPERDWVVVQPDVVPVRTSEKVVVRCTEVEDELDRLDCAREVKNYEAFMADPDSVVDPEEAYWIVRPPHWRQARRFVVELPSDPSSTYAPCLFGGLTYPDWVSRIQGGYCFLCNGRREICPGCTDGAADEYGAFMGCGVQLACPNCMGLETCWEDKRYLEKYYWKRAPEVEREAREARINARRRELGYGEVRWDLKEDTQIEDDEEVEDGDEHSGDGAQG